MIVTPWEVKGKVDYERLIREFGTQPLNTDLLKRVEKHTDSLHLQLERKIFQLLNDKFRTIRQILQLDVYLIR